MNDLSTLTAAELLAAFAEGQATPVAAVEACLARIESLEPEINTIRLLRADEALVEARASAARWEEGTAGPLDGVPFGLKDIVATAGVTTTGGSAMFRDHVPSETASHAQRLLDAGAILLAKLETFEFACGGPHNRTFGPVRNPWDLRRTTGGSSSGSGAAVAARMMPLSIGTDTGGSVRIPAAYCGLTGLKPTYGRVPHHGVMGMSWTLDNVGPMTRSAEDAALMMDVIAGHDPRDPSSSMRPVPDYSGRLRAAPSAPGRIGRLRGWFEADVDDPVMAAHEEALGVLAAMGHQIVDVEVPDVEVAVAAAWQVCYPEMLSLHEAHFPLLEDRDAMGAGVLAATPFVSAVDYLRAMRYRTVFQQALATAMVGCTALALPGLDAAPPLLEDLTTDASLQTWLATAVKLHIPFNYAGVPAVCIPAGLIETEPGGVVPTSLQLVGLPHQDAELLALAHTFQSATGFHRLAPDQAASRAAALGS